MRKIHNLPASMLLGLALTALVGAGCDDDDGDQPSPGKPDASIDGATNPITPDSSTSNPSLPDGGQSNPANGGMDGGTPDAGPAKVINQSISGKYVISVVVLAPVGQSDSSYVMLVDSLDTTALDFKKGIEFVGQADIAVYDGKLYVSDGEAPKVYRYALSADKKSLVKDGELSFAKYGDSAVSVDSTVNTFISPTKAYIAGPAGSVVIWNPSTMSLAGDIAPSAMIPDPGADYTEQNSPGIARNNRYYRMFYWINWDTYESPAAQFIATYDTTTDTLISVVPEARCPALGTSTVDASGNIYFSNWYYNLADTILNKKGSACGLRLPAGSDTLDANYKFDFKAITGHEGAQLVSYNGNNATFAVFHEENFTVMQDTSGYDLVSSENWETWTVDLANNQAKPVSGIARLGAQQNVFTLDGRSFLFAPNQAFDETKVYEIKTDGTSRLAYTFAGFSRAFLPL